MKKDLKKGFTLIELLVVVAIIAILALIVLLALNPVEMARRSRDSRRLSDLGTIRRAIDLALADKQSLITAEFDITPSTSVTLFDGGTLNLSKYLSVVPQDPSNDGTPGTVQVISYDGTNCVPTTGIDKGTMVYHYWSDGNNYVLSARLESMENCIAILQDGNTDGNYQIGTDPGLDLFE